MLSEVVEEQTDQDSARDCCVRDRKVESLATELVKQELHRLVTEELQYVQSGHEGLPGTSCNEAVSQASQIRYVQTCTQEMRLGNRAAP